MIAQSYVRYGPYRYLYTIYRSNGESYRIIFDGKHRLSLNVPNIESVERMAKVALTYFLDSTIEEGNKKIATWLAGKG